MKLKNIFTLLLAGFTLAGATSCIEEVQYEPAEPVALAPYYFSTANGDREDLEEDQSSFSILLGRIDDKEELTLAVKHTCTDASLFQAPDYVTFAAGEATVEYVVTFDIAKVEKRKEYTLNLALDGIENTPYYLGSLDLTIYYNPWESIGTGIYVENLIPSIFDVPSHTYQVEVQEHPTTKGYYRMVNPYAPGVYPIKGLDYGNANRYVYVNAVDPEGVYVETSNTGFCANSQYGTIVIASKAYLNMEDGQTLEEQKEQNLTGTYNEETKNIVIGKEKIAMAMTLYNNGSFGFSNSAGAFRLVLPGGKLPSDWDTVGFCNYTDGFAGPFFATPQLNHTYRVLVEYNDKLKQYRIVDPFGPESGYTTSAQSKAEYIYFDVTNPECVTVGEPIATPIINVLKGGQFFATTLADQEIANGVSKEELAEIGIGGKFNGKEIRIPADQVVGYYINKPANVINQPSPVEVVLDLTPLAEAPGKAKAPFQFNT